MRPYVGSKGIICNNIAASRSDFQHIADGRRPPVCGGWAIRRYAVEVRAHPFFVTDKLWHWLLPLRRLGTPATLPAIHERGTGRPRLVHQHYHSLQITARRRFAGSGIALLVAYNQFELISNTDTLTSWLERAVGPLQDNNNLRGERSLSSQDVPQRLVISYVLDLPFGQGRSFFPM